MAFDDEHTKHEAEESWDVYATTIEDKFAVISVNTEPTAQGPDEQRPVLIVLSTDILDADEHGMPTEAEANRHYAIEDALVAAYEPLNALFAGRVTRDGQRWLFFYVGAGAGDDAERITTEATQQLTFDAQVVFKTQDDPEWECYFTFLYPIEAQATRSNRLILRELVDSGDQINTPRQIMHYAYFPTEASRAAFATAITAQAFVVDETMDEPDDTVAPAEAEAWYPFGIRFSRDDSPMEIDPVTLYLMEAAEDAQGRYDGWETPLVKQ